MNPTTESVVLSEADGIKAIIFLQKEMAIDEPEDRARRGWQAMSDREKEWTMKAYNALKTQTDKKARRQPKKETT